MSNNIFTSAVIQQAVDGNNKQENFAKTSSFVRESAAAGARLIVLQELHATRYFCQTEDVDNFALAEDLNGETFESYARLAGELDVVLVISGFEKRAPGLYHNTAQVIDGKRGRVGVYRKMHIPDDPGFCEKFYFTPGDSEDSAAGFSPIETRLGKLGVLVCWDQWFPEAARLMALGGAELLIYPTAIGWDPNDEEDEKHRQLEAWRVVQRSHAVANGLPVLVANRTGYEPSDDNETAGIEFWGNSFVAGPQGEIFASACSEEEGPIFAVIDKNRSAQVRNIWPFFRDRRIDSYKRLLNRWGGNG